MISFAHVILTCVYDETSDLRRAQPITVETMVRARAFPAQGAKANLYQLQFKDEERMLLPEAFRRLPDLERSISDLKPALQGRKLPLIKDILDALYQAGEADYLIYTNVDIALQPHFYDFAARTARQGFDAFVVNRRTISDKYTDISQLPLMYKDPGEEHKGYDCFIFRRELYPAFDLGDICIGTAWIGRALLANLAAVANRFREFRREHLTFHLGDSGRWREEASRAYLAENSREYRLLFDRIESRRGPFGPQVRSYLLETGDQRLIPDFDRQTIAKGQLGPLSTQSQD